MTNVASVAEADVATFGDVPAEALFMAALGVVVDGAVERRDAVVDLVDLLEDGQVDGEDEQSSDDDDENLLGARQR